VQIVGNFFAGCGLRPQTLVGCSAAFLKKLGLDVRLAGFLLPLKGREKNHRPGAIHELNEVNTSR